MCNTPDSIPPQGLPPQWDTMLQSSGISKDDVSAHPQEVLDVLQFHMEGPPPMLPKKAQVEKEVSSAFKFSRDNPRSLFTDFKMLGEGYAVLRFQLPSSALLTLLCFLAVPLVKCSLRATSGPIKGYDGSPLSWLCPMALLTPQPQVAVKVASARDAAMLKNEIAIQKLSKHPNIVNCREAFFHETNVWVSRCLVFGSCQWL